MAIEVRVEEIGAIVLIIFGAAMGTFGLLELADSYTTMKQIETLGAVGQVAAKEQYAQSAEGFRLALVASVGGIMITLAGIVQNAIVEMQKTLEDLG